MNLDLIEQSFEKIAPRAPQLASRFYDRLFRDFPQVRPMFQHLNPDDQQKKLIASLVFIVQNLRDNPKLTAYLEDLGYRHVSYGTQTEHYPAVGQTLLLTLAEFAGNFWTPEVATSWKEAVNLVAEVMLRGAARRSVQTAATA